MIKGFEEETGPLTDSEVILIPRFIKGLQNRIGEKHAITSFQMIASLKIDGIKCTGARVRKIINHIRLKGYVKNLVATSKGYYIENDEKKLRAYIYSLRQRAGAIMAVASSYGA